MSIMYFCDFKHVFFVGMVWMLRMVPAAGAGYQEANNKKIDGKEWEDRKRGEIIRI